MALNFSHRPVFPTHISEDNLVSPMRREGNDRFDRGGSPDSVSKDIIDVLPSDPFGMDIGSTITAITGWLENLEGDYGDYPRNKFGLVKEEYGLFPGLSLIWNRTMRFQPFPEDMLSIEKSKAASWTDPCREYRDFGGVLQHGGGFGSGHKDENKMSFKSGNSSALLQENQDSLKGLGCCSDIIGETPHEALPFALSYLGLRDLLSVERVCRSLRTVVQRDPFLWRNIHIDQPLSERITDDILLQLTSRAQGNLQCLSLVECPRITNDCLKLVLDNNPRLSKLCVPGCTRLSIEGILNSVKAFNYHKNTTGIKNLRIGGLYGVTHEHFEELKLLLGADRQMKQNGHKPHFYNRGKFYLLCDDDRAIDIEICPRCKNIRLVYDCAAEGCQSKDFTSQVCRACTLCIPRCVQCGRCINDSEYEETFCLELLCSNCFKQVLNCQEKQDRKVGLIKYAINPDSSNSVTPHG